MKRHLLQLLLLLCSGTASAQLPRTESFETDGNNVTGRYTSNTFNQGNNNYSFRTNYVQGSVPSGYSTSSRLYGVNGTYYWATEGLKNSTTLAGVPGYVQLSPTTVTGYTALKVTLLMADPEGAGSVGGLGRWESDDFIRIKARVNPVGSTGTWETIGQFVGDNSNSGGNDGFMRRDTAKDNTSTNDPISGTNVGQLTATLTPFTFNVTGTGATLDVMVEIDQSGNSEEFAFDNIQITGTVSSNASPVLLTNETTALAYTEGTIAVPSLAVAIAPNITATDADDATLSSAAIQISTNFDATEDILAFTGNATTGNIVAGTFNTVTRTLTLTSAGSTATKAQWQSALRMVTYQNTDNADASPLTRTITFTVTDPSNGISLPVTRNITVTTALDVAAPPPYTEDFTTDGEGTRYATNHFIGSSNAATFQRTNATPYTGGFLNRVTFTNISPATGSYYFYGTAMSNASSPNVPKPVFIQTRKINASAYYNLQFQVRLGASSTWQSSDYVKFYYRLGSGSWVIFGSFRSTDQVTVNAETPLRQDANPNNLSSAPTGTALTTALQNFSFALPAALNGQQVDFRIESASEISNAELAIDLIQVTGTPATAPTLTTGTAGSISNTSVSINNNTLTGDGGAGFSAYGVVYVAGTSTPTTSNSKVQVGTSSPGTFPANFTGNLTGLTPNTQYTARAYATNNVGTSYGANVTFTTITNPLSVELTAFTAVQEGPAAVLHWTTVQENNSDRFEVEASTDGKEFDRIGTVAGQGTTNKRTDYRFEDKQILKYGKRVYYRLKSIELSGTATYSLVRSVNLNSHATDNLILTPNPGRTTTLTGAQPGAAVDVYDALGRRVLMVLADANGQARLILPAGLASGVYLVRSGAGSIRLVVQ